MYKVGFTPPFLFDLRRFQEEQGGMKNRNVRDGFIQDANEEVQISHAIQK